MAPAEGHEGGGLGSINSEGSRMSSEYSLTRSNATIDCSRPTKRRTMNNISPVIVLAKVSANAASEALMAGVMRDTRAVAVITPHESRLNRTESHLLTRGIFSV